MNIVVADDLPASALDLLRSEGWTIDARSGRTPDQLSADLAQADALVVRSATKVTAALMAMLAAPYDAAAYLHFSFSARGETVTVAWDDVPVRWFVLFDDEERRLLEVEGHHRLSYLTTTRKALRRAEDAVPVLRQSELGPIGVGSVQA